jgi:hypothetical protein
MKFAIMVESSTMPHTINREYNDITKEDARQIFYDMKNAYAKYKPMIQMLVWKDKRWVGFLRN